MSTLRYSRLAFAGRLILLFLLAGHLLLRQVFAHISLTTIIRYLGHVDPAVPRPAWIPAAFDYAFITELLLLLLLPLAAYLLLRRDDHQYEAGPGREADARRIGLAACFAFGLLAWGAFQALASIFFGPRQGVDLPPEIATVPPPDWYLILRQSAMAGYALFFLYTSLFFRARERYILQAAIVGVVVSVACAALDLNETLGKPTIDETLFGQQTLPISMLAAIFIIVSFDSFLVRAVAIAILGFVGWRQSLRFQSGVVVSLVGALVLYFLLGLWVSRRGQARTFYRGIACIAMIVIVALVVYFRSMSSPKMAEKLASLSPGTYKTLLINYDLGRPPANPKERMTSNREPFGQVSDPEVYHLEAVYDTGNSVSVLDNIWRILVWRRMLHEWYERNPIIGSGVGQRWFYEALYHTKFHYGEKREGLDPHNSYLNMLHRYGLVGLLIFAGLAGCVLMSICKALRLHKQDGDLLLEGITLYFFYTMVFAFFNNALEGPSYAMPFWFSMGLAYARARQLLVKPLPID
jgi:hypothetical protein